MVGFVKEGGGKVKVGLGTVEVGFLFKGGRVFFVKFLVREGVCKEVLFFDTKI